MSEHGKKTFIKYCTQQLNQVFMAIKKGTPDNKLKHRIEGLMMAGELLGAINRTEASELIEKQHVAVFGESSLQRAKRKKVLQDLKDTSQDDYFDIPAIERRT